MRTNKWINTEHWWKDSHKGMSMYFDQKLPQCRFFYPDLMETSHSQSLNGRNSGAHKKTNTCWQHGYLTYISFYGRKIGQKKCSRHWFRPLIRDLCVTLVLDVITGYKSISITLVSHTSWSFQMYLRHHPLFAPNAIGRKLIWSFHCSLSRACSC